MDPTTIIGVVMSIALILNGIMGSGDLGNFIDPPSILIVVGGTIGAIIASFPLRILKNVGKHMAIIMNSKKYRPEPVIDTLAEFAQIARKDGLLALESQLADLKDPFLKKSVMYVVDSLEASKIRSILEKDIESMSARHSENADMYVRGSAYAPAFGMIGTLVGLINMLKNMDLSSGSNDALAQNMSIALVTTFYGSFLSNVIFHPIASKLNIRDAEEVIYKEIIMEGVIGILQGDTPKNLKENLASSLEQKRQTKMAESEGGDGGGGKGKKGKK